MITLHVTHVAERKAELRVKRQRGVRVGVAERRLQHGQIVAVRGHDHHVLARVHALDRAHELRWWWSWW